MRVIRILPVFFWVPAFFKRGAEDPSAPGAFRLGFHYIYPMFPVTMGADHNPGLFHMNPIDYLDKEVNYHPTS